MHEKNWSQPNPTDMQDAGGPLVPDTESLLAEIGASYPIVSYPAPASTAEDMPAEERVEETIFAGLVWP